jgi:hypothetical protein
MWRVEGDVAMDVEGHGYRMLTFRNRCNPYEEYTDGECFSRYRFPKPIFGELVDILDASLETRTGKVYCLS